MATTFNSDSPKTGLGQQILLSRGGQGNLLEFIWVYYTVHLYISSQASTYLLISYLPSLLLPLKLELDIRPELRYSIVTTSILLSSTIRGSSIVGIHSLEIEIGCFRSSII